jgi:hypothetical protein
MTYPLKRRMTYQEVCELRSATREVPRPGDVVTVNLAIAGLRGPYTAYVVRNTPRGWVEVEVSGRRRLRVITDPAMVRRNRTYA